MHTASVIGLILVILGLLVAFLALLLDPPTLHPKALTIAVILIGVGVLLGAEPITAAVH